MGAQLTLQDLARDLLEPMMRDWLDKNALRIVENVVQVEFARAIGRAAET
jgi:cell pole-organizing protein PopZ